MHIGLEQLIYKLDVLEYKVSNYVYATSKFHSSDIRVWYDHVLYTIRALKEEAKLVRKYNLSNTVNADINQDVEDWVKKSHEVINQSRAAINTYFETNSLPWRV